MFRIQGKTIATCLMAAWGLTATAQQHFTIRGSIAPEYEGQKVYLVAEGSRTPTDSAVVNAGAFTLQGTVQEPVFTTLQTPAHITFTLILEEGSINVDCTEKTVTGTPTNDRYNRLSQAVTDAYIQLAQAHQDEAKSMSQDEKLKLFQKVMQEGAEKTIPLYEQGALDNLDNIIPGYLLTKYHRQFKPEVIDRIVAGASPALQADAAYKRFLSYYEGTRNTAVGNRYMDITMKTPEGKELSLSSVVGRGHYVLVDFWASWCAPCRAEMPNVKAAYQKYHDKGFDIVGISLDNNRDAWVKSIESLQLPWFQMSDLKGWSSPCVAQYGISGIPFTLLISPKGEIVAKNLRGEALHQELERLLK